ncbi:glycine cleavage system protein GcvH [Atopococcus tabaci]|uniref:glycine cleavage system protein GcvH n=1 Tax=Atopococcus tabaci TaxID=269774 RepID=UPI000422F452|nr:glycine cleavage system protein GcvH [Atopococcus tabaci]
MAANKEAFLYTKEHEWIEVKGETVVRIGITDYAVDQLGDIVFVDLPETDSEFIAEEEFATVESVKSTSEIYAPVSGSIQSVNSRLEDEPEVLNESPFEDGWLVEIESPEPFSQEGLLSYEEYQNYLSELED